MTSVIGESLTPNDSMDIGSSKYYHISEQQEGHDIIAPTQGNIPVNLARDNHANTRVNSELKMRANNQTMKRKAKAVQTPTNKY